MNAEGVYKDLGSKTARRDSIISKKINLINSGIMFNEKVLYSL